MRDQPGRATIAAHCECLTRVDVRERPPLPNIAYRGFVDPSGGRSDSMALAIAHRDANMSVVIDAIREVSPPFSPESAVGEFARLLNNYRVNRV